MRRVVAVGALLAGSLLLRSPPSDADDVTSLQGPTSGPAADTAAADDETWIALAMAVEDVTGLQQNLAALQAANADLQARRDEITEDIDALRSSLAMAEEARDRALGGVEQAMELSSSRAVIVPREGRVIVRLAASRPEQVGVQALQIDADEAVGAAAVFSQRLAEANSRLEGIDVTRAELADQTEEGRALLEAAEQRLEAIRALLAVASAHASAGFTPGTTLALTRQGIPVIADVAMRRAVRLIGLERPDCHVPFAVLAAISQVESNHGRFGGAQVGLDGHVLPPVRGPVLDGTAFPKIPDSDNGRLDGDPNFDRAVGPLQFIPQTWAYSGRDGNNDGIADPDNYYDAALSAAAYLCAAGGDLAVPERLTAAVYAYNASPDYVQLVLSLTVQYTDRPRPPGPAVGTSSTSASATGPS